MSRPATDPAKPPFAGRTQWNLAPNRLSQALEFHRRSGRELLDLIESNPTRCGFHYDSNAILKAFLDPANLSYQPDPRGLLSAREAVAAYYAEHGAVVDPQNIILTTSTSEGYNFLFRLLCDPGAELLAPQPSYPLLGYLAGLNDIAQHPYQLIYDHGWHLDFETLRRAATSLAAAVIVIHPNNPTGSFVRANELPQLNTFCGERGLAIIADEVFLDYAHNAEQERPSFTANHEVLTFTLSGLSKLSALPQMKLAWLVVSGPKRLREEALARLEVIADTFLSVSTPAQHALPALLGQRYAIGSQVRERIAANLRELDQQLARQQLCRRLHSDGGWYAVLRVPVTRSDDDLALLLLEQQNVFVHPGHFYEFPRDGFLVLSLITPLDRFQTGLERLLHAIASAGL